MGYNIGAILALREKFYSLKWYEVYDFIEFCLNEFSISHREDFVEELNKIFEEERASYRIIGNLVTPLTSEVEIKEIERALEVSDKYHPVRDHINKALTQYSKRPNPDYANSIKESISSLEALARSVCNSPKATLGDLTKKLSIHPAFRMALNKLYGWTSNEKGIRHSETGERITYEKTGEAEARFMLVLASAFVNYVISKYEKK